MMDITIQREALLKPLQSISGVVEKKQTLPILSNVLMTVKDEKLLLIGTDLEIELIGIVDIESLITAGAVTVSARKLFDICRTSLEGARLRFTLEGNSLVVRTQDSHFILNTLPTQDFPHLENISYPITLKLHQHLLKKLLSQTYFAMGQQDVRHYLNGTFLDISKGAIKCVAADGHRLALTSIQDERVGNIETQVILPRKSVLELMRLLSDENKEEAKIGIADGRLCVTTSDYIFTTKLINAQYPDYSRLIPRGTLIATGDREVIKLRITANNADQEQAEEAVTLDYSGSNIELGFNVAYLLDVVSSITSKTIRCAFTDPNNGVLIESAESDQSLYVVMPMRL